MAESLIAQISVSNSRRKFGTDSVSAHRNTGAVHLKSPHEAILERFEAYSVHREIPFPEFETDPDSQSLQHGLKTDVGNVDLLKAEAMRNFRPAGRGVKTPVRRDMLQPQFLTIDAASPDLNF